LASDPTKKLDPLQQLASIIAELREHTTKAIIDAAGLPDPKAAMDADGDGTISLEEAAAYALAQPDWERFRKPLGLAGIRHPLDASTFPPRLKARIEELVRRTESGIPEKRGEPGYCEAFVPAFVDAGKPSFKKGGLCFGSTEKRTLSIEREPEMTAAESFALCLHPNRGVYGSCTEKTYQVMAALKAADIPCDVRARLTENHLYPAVGERSVDPARIGEIGWSFEIQPAAAYLWSLALKGSSRLLVDIEQIEQIAVLMEPGLQWNVTKIKEGIQELKTLYARKEFLQVPIEGRPATPDPMSLDDPSLRGLLDIPNEHTPASQPQVLGGSRWQSDLTDPSERIQETIRAILDELDAVLTANPKTIVPLLSLRTHLFSLPTEGRIDVALAVLKRWPQNPYALQPLLFVIGADTDLLHAERGDAAAARRFDESARRLAGRLSEEFPFSGIAETVLATAAEMMDRIDERNTFALKALAHNPRNASALQMLARDDLANGRYEATDALIRDAIAAAPNMAGNHYTLALTAQLRNDFALAEAEAGKEATVFTRNATASWLAVNLALLRGQPAKAMALLNWRGNGETAQLLRGHRSALAQALQLTGDVREARRLMLQQLESAPADPGTHVMLASLALQENDVAAARSHIRKLRGPASKAVRLQMEFQVTQVENDLPGMRGLLEEMRRLPGIDPTLLARSDIAVDIAQGRLDEARRKTLAMSPLDYSSSLNVIHIDILQGRLPAVEQCAAAFAKAHPDLFWTKTLRASLLLRKERFREALAVADAALAINPRASDALTAKGFALLKLARTSEALAIGKQLDKMLPHQAGGKYLMARTLLAMGKPEKAKELLPDIKSLENYDLISWPLFSSSALECEIEAALEKR
jgi:tetratricopeptide (TPR) repeat protein